MSSRFSLLKPSWTSLAEICMSAENHLYNDPNACVMELGKFAECVTKELLQSEGLSDPVNQFDRINILEHNGVLSREIVNALHQIRKSRNDAIHQNMKITSVEAQIRLNDAYIVAQWFMRYYGFECKAPSFNVSVPPVKKAEMISPRKVPSHPVFPPETHSNSKGQHKHTIIILSILLALSVLMNIGQFIMYRFF